MAPTKKGHPASGGGDQDAADAAVTAAAAAAGDRRVPDSSLQGTGPAAGAIRAPARDAPAALAPAEVRVIELTGEVNEDAPEEVASAGALQHPAPAPAGVATAAAGDATQAAPPAASDMGQPLPAETVAAGSSSSAGAAFSLGARELAGRSWGRITFDPSVFQQGHQVIDNIQQQ
ncbi:skin secretory protein xP2-like [Brachypodium distachyon]|uniref:skin secretory protein xP2-like n=1 Tax=Brachypodium distachyon TaxID=15368 RepID=UPI000D0CAE2D|nr:skin secretory protein xP2-like [Brachypodium distachyon]|eukprot:XP_024311487.1 skin secretory protein xP2-like [Brachypodium distachyon]